jgi:hypothetical protein
MCGGETRHRPGSCSEWPDDPRVRGGDVDALVDIVFHVWITPAHGEKTSRPCFKHNFRTDHPRVRE